MVTKISITLEPIGSEQATNGQLAAPHIGAGLQVVKVKLPARVACKSMDRQKYQSCRSQSCSAYPLLSAATPHVGRGF
jgi:hypothetical protein